MTWLLDAIATGTWQGLLMLLRIAAFIAPVLIALEWTRATGWLGRLTARLEPLCRRLDLPSELAPALTMGTVLGVILGSGVLLETTREHPVPRHQVTLLFVFVGIFHAMFEETVAIFAIGGNGLVMVLTRFAFAALAALLYRSWLVYRLRTVETAALAPRPARPR